MASKARRGGDEGAAAGTPHTADTLQIDRWLRELGYDTPAAIKRARALLEAAGLTRAGKQGIAASKRASAETTLLGGLARVCSAECALLSRKMGGPRRAPVVTSAARCEVCGGSNNRRAAYACARALRSHRISRVLVVGGTPQQQQELAQLLMFDGLVLEFVDGMRASHSQKDAIANMNRAQLIVIWGSTPLRHSVSNLYTDDPPDHVRIITTSKRGIEALCREVIRSYGGGL